MLKVMAPLPQVLILLAPVLAFTVPLNQGVSVLVTGATGRTGQILYAYLKTDPRVAEVRALVHGSGTGSPEERKKAAAALNCSACDASDGIFYGDITVPSSLTAAFHGMDTVAITTTTGRGAFGNDTLTKEVDFVGIQNQAAAIATGASDVSAKRVVLCTRMGTAVSPFGPRPSHGPPAFLRNKQFWGLNAEAFLGSSGIPNTIVKPCGLDGKYGRGGKELLVGHDDRLPRHGMISRQDLAAVMVEAVASRASGLRFDLCVGIGAPTTNLAKLLDDARYPWAKGGQTTENGVPLVHDPVSHYAIRV